MNGDRKSALMMRCILAFGQGVGGVEVDETACAWFHKRYHEWIDKPKENDKVKGRKPIDEWDKEGEGFLRKFKEIGAKAAASGGTITEASLTVAATAVEKDSDCPWCPITP